VTFSLFRNIGSLARGIESDHKRRGSESNAKAEQVKYQINEDRLIGAFVFYLSKRAYTLTISEGGRSRAKKKGFWLSELKEPTTETQKELILKLLLKI